MRNNRGFFHIHLSWIIFVLAVIGAWYIYKNLIPGSFTQALSHIAADWDVNKYVKRAKDLKLLQTYMPQKFFYDTVELKEEDNRGKR